MPHLNSACARAQSQLPPALLQQLVHSHRLLIAYARLLFADLYADLASTSTAFVLTDAAGYVLELHSSPDTVAHLGIDLDIRLGVCLAANSCGQTAVSQVLDLRRPCTMRGEQHTCDLLQGCWTIAAPIVRFDGALQACVVLVAPAEEVLGEKQALVRCIASELGRVTLAEPSANLPTALGSAESRPVRLTPRQWQVLQLFAQGLGYKQIARKMGIASKTVEEHLDVVRKKLGVEHRRQCIQRAAELGFLQ